MLSLLGAIFAVFGILAVVCLLMVLIGLLVGAGTLFVNIACAVIEYGAVIIGVAIVVWFLWRIFGKKDKKD